MKTIKQMVEDVNAILTELGDMRTLCTQENRSPTTEEIAFGNGKLAEIEGLEAAIKLEERTQGALGRQQEPDGEVVKPVISPAQQRVANDREHFATDGEFYQAVMRAGSPGGFVDPRLSTRAASGLSEGVPSDGGFLVDTVMSNEMLKNVWSSGEILPRISKVTLSGNVNGMKFNGLDETSRVNGSRAGGILAYWAAEAAQKTGSKPKFRQISLSLNKLIGLCYATDELLEDSNALSQTLNEGFRDEFDFRITDAIINGSGAGQPLGILNSGCVVSVAGEAGQAVDTIVYENINNMWSRMMAASRPNSVWIVNQDCEPQLNSMSLAVGTGGVPVYMPAGGASAQPYGTLFGRPVVPIEHCPTVGDTGDIMLCDFSKYKAIDKGGMKSDISMHVMFIYDEQTFRFVYRFDGQPVLGSAITPFKGTNTLSHFIKLDAR
jgi:HK97 family phage major capsid protein